MQNKQIPSEGKIDKRITALGVIGFLGLAGVFFLLAFFSTPIVRSYLQSRTQTPQTVYNPPVHRQGRGATQAQEEPQQPLDVEITEQVQEGTPAEDPGSGDNGVRQDENSLTITLEPEGQDTPPARPAEPERPRKHSTSQETARRETSTTERPRASTERHASTSPDRIYRVQAGTFASRTNAETLADDLKGKGYHPEIKAVQTEGSTLYRVQLGGYKAQDDAKELAKDLSDEGYTPTMITEKAD